MAANDGSTFQQQPVAVQNLYIFHFGADAEGIWEQEHNAALASRRPAPAPAPPPPPPEVRPFAAPPPPPPPPPAPPALPAAPEVRPFAAPPAPPPPPPAPPAAPPEPELTEDEKLFKARLEKQGVSDSNIAHMIKNPGDFIDPASGESVIQAEAAKERAEMAGAPPPEPAAPAAAVHAGDTDATDYDFEVVRAGYTADELLRVRAGKSPVEGEPSGALTGEGESNWRVKKEDGSAGPNAGWLQWRMQEAEALGIDTSGWITKKGTESFYSGPGAVDLQGQINQAKIGLGTPGAMKSGATDVELAAAMKLAKDQEDNGNGNGNGTGNADFDAAIEALGKRLADTEDELRKSNAVMAGIEQANQETLAAQRAAGQQLEAIDVLSQPRASFFSQFARAPLSTAEKPVSIQAGPELSAVMRGQPIAPYGTIEGPFETIENRPEAIRRAFEGAVDRITSETITGMTPTALQQLGVLGQIGGYFPTDVFRAREAAIPKEPRLVRSQQIG